MLSSPLKRAQHDDVLKSRGWLKSLVSAPKAVRYIGDVADNVKSRALLLSRRVQDGELSTELAEVRGGLSRLLARITKKFSHFSRLPTALDRVELAVEMVFAKTTLVAAGFLILVFLL